MALAALEILSDDLMSPELVDQARAALKNMLAAKRQAPTRRTGDREHASDIRIRPGQSFGRTRALDGLDLTVRPGEVHGFLGPNGSGKSTTIRVLLGLLRADAGTVRLLGGDPWRDATELHRRLAYVPGDVTLWPNLSGGEVIDLLGRMRGGLDARRRAELLDRFELDPRKKGRAYSRATGRRSG